MRTRCEPLADRCRPGVTEYQLKAAAAGAILEGGGDVDFAIIGSTPMRNPALIFGNPRPSGPRAQQRRYRHYGTGRGLPRL